MAPDECIRSVATFDPAIKLAFYINFANHLTIAIRSIWSEHDVAVAERYERMKWMNEVMHRVLNRAGDVQALSTYR